MAVDDVAAFWSYTHRDDEQVGNRITRLAARIQEEFSLITGDDLEIFVDRAAIRWGEQWRQRINAALQATTFFVPIITPRYFKSQECRNELLTFAQAAKSLGAVELLLPVLFVRVPDLSPDNPDELVELVARTQYADWTELRLLDEDSADYLQAVNGLAKRLAEVQERLLERPTTVPESTAQSAASGEAPEVDDEPGFIDLIAEFEMLLPKWQATIQAFPPVMEQISDLTTDATSRLQQGDAQGKGFAFRVLVLRELAADLGAPADKMMGLGEQYTSQLLALDPGLRAMISLVGRQELDDADRASAGELFEAIRGLVNASRENAVSLQEFVDVLNENARSSRDLRPPLNRIQTGLRSVLDGQAVIDEWDRLISETPSDVA